MTTGRPPALPARRHSEQQSSSFWPHLHPDWTEWLDRTQIDVIMTSLMRADKLVVDFGMCPFNTTSCYSTPAWQWCHTIWTAVIKWISTTSPSQSHFLELSRGRFVVPTLFLTRGHFIDFTVRFVKTGKRRGALNTSSKLQSWFKKKKVLFLKWTPPEETVTTIRLSQLALAPPTVRLRCKEMSGMFGKKLSNEGNRPYEYMNRPDQTEEMVTVNLLLMHSSCFYLDPF